MVADYETELPTATACFMDDFEACIAHLRMPITHRRAIRTTNLLERLFVEERPQLKIIPNAFGEEPVLKLMFGATIRAAERWRAIKVTELERRQMRAVREELHHEYQAPRPHRLWTPPMTQALFRTARCMRSGALTYASQGRVIRSSSHSGKRGDSRSLTNIVSLGENSDSDGQIGQGEQECQVLNISEKPATSL